MGSTRPMWVGLDLCDELGLVGVNFFLTYHGGLSQKIPLTRPNPTHAHPWVIFKNQRVRQCPRNPTHAHP